MSDQKNIQTPKRRPGGMGRGPGGPAGMMPGEKPKDFKGSLKKLALYLSVYKLRLFFVLIFAVASTIFMIVGPKILGKATTALFEGIMNMIANNGQGIDFNYIGQIILFLLGLYVISSIFSYIQGYIMTGVSMKVTYDLRRNIFAKINRLPFKYFDKTSYGEVLSFLTNDIETINQTLNQSITQIITSIATIIGILVMMLSISWQMTIVALLIVPTSFIIVVVIVKKSQPHFSEQQTYLGHINGHVEEMYSGHNVVKAFNGEQASFDTFDHYNDTLYSSAWKSQFLSGLMMPMMTFIGNIGYVAVCILGGYLAVNGRLSVGDIQAFIQYVRQFNQPIMQIANISNILQQTTAAAERVFTFLDEPEEIEESNTAFDLSKVSGRVDFDHVSFGYTPGKTIIKDFSAHIKEGQKIAIVGPTGAGKTTIVKLLMRFYDVESGAILVDGHNIKDFSRGDLRGFFGMVLQDTWLYNASIRDNIRYGRLDASDEEVEKAAVAAQVDYFVHTLPDGYNMFLNEEASNVSQGQKQLLTIARAILADPKVLILDEATSSVDTRTEVLIQKAMDNLMEGRTSFVIAHRLSTIKNADLILVMNEGDIVEQGNHDNLLAADGFYSKLYNSQFEKAEEEDLENELIQDLEDLIPNLN
ncbi:ABC transporter ATP-binding protein [Acetobacterium woodii]|uniref:ABC transport system ATP-binding/permease protein n=1 Tax=Acetobacterium woodii (strain ATCC 29683 / DSM 1030 / JCM 2381 / KCTC 1655 / WB1) TaxID=931626 RepID=H6LGD7_ACEWD|nr:ABC transporter ATP-binding protein [Acetobacterium woodii]AFA47073.1 ABC transport system ATP-binding/permease protein [Acetobacterium woodii DSM 1030]